MKIFTRLDNFGDKKLTLKRTKERDAFWFRLSKFADHSVIWFVLGIIKFAIDKNLKHFVIFVVVMAVESALTNGPIKFIFKRSRPHENEQTYAKGEKLPHGMRMPITSSFPSGHATAAMCAATLLGICAPLSLIFLYPLGIAVGYSRMYTRMHHLSDVLAGFILGLIYGYLAVAFFY
jgi:undecaprenyl-diphosphatase